MAIAEAVDAARMWRHHLELAQLGRRPDGGAGRLALGDDDVAARLAVAAWAAGRGFEVAVDAIGNLHVTRPGRDRDLPQIQTGSHLDTQPAGGHFDGVYGVLAGFEVLEALEDLGIETRRSVTVTSWTNEEGVRFSPPLMGSGVFAGAFALDAMLGAIDGSGASVRDALGAMEARLPAWVSRSAPPAPAAYVEAHIEQGPVLESGGHAIGVVAGIVGIRHYRVVVRGEAGHAGTVPMSGRADALRSATALATRLYDHADHWGDDIRLTIGRFEVRPGGPSTIPDEVAMVVDVRSADGRLLCEFEAFLERACLDAPDATPATLDRLMKRDPLQFDEGLLNRIANAAERQGATALRMPSGAGHDAMMIATLCPAAMIFIPCRDGISHNIREQASREHMAAGARVLAEVLADLATA